MYDLVVILAKYFFVFYAFMFFFGLNSCRIRENSVSGGFMMRFSVFCQHVTAFALLCNAGNEFSLPTLIAGLCSLAFLIAYSAGTWKKFDPVIGNCCLYLIDIGFISLARLDSELAVRQMIFCAAGMVISAFIPLIFRKLRFLEKIWPFYMALSLAMIALVFLFGSEQYGATNWVKIGPLSFQPSEFVKLSFILFIASMFRKGKPSMKRQLAACAVMGLILLTLVIQRDLGSALIFAFSFLLCYYCAGGSKLIVAAAPILAVAAVYAAITFVPSLMAHLAPRFEGWLHPFENAETSGYQLIVSLFAICTRGPFGTGLGRGLAYTIPIVEKDFIFANICEEMGYIFGIMVIVNFVIIFLRGSYIARQTKDRFKALCAFGFTSALAVQSFVIIGANIGMLPITGVTLPFISYGGSSVMVCGLMMGFVHFASRFRDVPTKDKIKDRMQDKMQDKFIDSANSGESKR